MTNPDRQDTEFKRFAAKRIIIGVILIVAVLWTLGGIMGIIERPEPIPQTVLGGSSHDTEAHEPQSQAAVADSPHGAGDTHTGESGHNGSKVAAHGDGHAGSEHQDNQAAGSGDQHGNKAAHAASDEVRHATVAHGSNAHGDDQHAEATHGESAHKNTQAEHEVSAHDEAAHKDTHGGSKGAAHGDAAHGDGHESAVSEAIAPKLPVHREKGVATVEAIIAPIEYELEERFWGWRPNDLINLTDNVNNYQLGVLEVTRRAVVALNERISRTGVTDAFDPDLENATNWFMIKATKYWFPSAESKYREGIADLKKYRDSLEGKRATFYTRTDNLIPLLASFEDLLGACDENLVKHVEEDGTEVSWFKADNYFYYAQGVASSMAPILEAIHHDFLITLETRHGIELLHHAVESCRTAAALKPWIITDSALDGILANHRANMAAPISHARFYLGVLIKALST